jgi:hypothetical protein
MRRPCPARATSVDQRGPRRPRGRARPGVTCPGSNRANGTASAARRCLRLLRQRAAAAAPTGCGSNRSTCARSRLIRPPATPRSPPDGLVRAGSGRASARARPTTGHRCQWWSITTRRPQRCPSRSRLAIEGRRPSGWRHCWFSECRDTTAAELPPRRVGSPAAST